MWNYNKIYKLLEAYHTAKNQSNYYRLLSEELNAYDIMYEMANLSYAFDNLSFEELIRLADMKKKVYDMLSIAWKEETKYRYDLIPSRWWTNR